MSSAASIEYQPVFKLPLFRHKWLQPATCHGKYDSSILYKAYLCCSDFPLRRPALRVARNVSEESTSIHKQFYTMTLKKDNKNARGR
eukprot:g60246.t1